jgi:hypothetical protein
MLFPFKGKYTPPAEDPPAKRPRTDQQDAPFTSSGPQATTGTIQQAPLYGLAKVVYSFILDPFRQFMLNLPKYSLFKGGR